MSIVRDPGGPPSPLDICFCGERLHEHPTTIGCLEFQSLRNVTNNLANAISELVETLLLVNVLGAVTALEDKQ